MRRIVHLSTSISKKDPSEVKSFSRLRVFLVLSAKSSTGSKSVEALELCYN